MDEERARDRSGFKIFKDQSLGSGAYGRVCKAEWYGLMCAAKIIHPTLADRHQPGRYQQHRLPIERFEQECRFMTVLKHPNIVQYLGLYRDLETDLPVLVTELMHANLTAYLESSPQPIPFHLQVNISHDISLALSFLHSNNVVHRDLSGSNVLLTANTGNSIRAKIADFGMAKLGEAVPHMFSHTACPGTGVYMPPEALQEQPVYSEKIDCFSFGVVVLQILTRRFPKPENRQRKIPGNHPDYPGGMIMVCVPEIDRRQEHIQLVDQRHPLLFIALDCLRDKDGERPTAQQICERVAVLKQLKTYVDSIKDQNPAGAEQIQGLQQIMQAQTIRLQEKERELQQLRQQCGYKDQIMRQLREGEVHLTQQNGEKDRIIHQLREQLDHAMENYKIIKTKDGALAESEQTIAQLKQQVVQLEQLVQHKDHKIVSNYQVAQQKDVEIQQLRIQLHAVLRDGQKGSVEHAKDRFQNDQISSAVNVVQNLAPPASQRTLENKRQNQLQESDKSAVLKPIDEIKLTWREGNRAQKGLTRMCDAAVSANDNVVYILPFSSKDATVCMFEIATKTWSSLKSFPYGKCSLALINDFLVVIGGCIGQYQFSNKLYHWTGVGEEGKWSPNLFPAMPTERANTSALVTNKNLLVVGGENRGGALAVVEVMNTVTHQWSAVASLTEPLLNASMTACGGGGDIYLLGGMNKNNESNKFVYTCTLPILLEIRENSQNMWQKISDSPLLDSTCVSLQGKLVAVGGVDATGRLSNDVFMFNSLTKSWKSVGKLSKARHSSVAAALPDNRVMVVGGWSESHSKMDSVEFGSIE